MQASLHDHGNIKSQGNFEITIKCNHDSSNGRSRLSITCTDFFRVKEKIKKTESVITAVDLTETDVLDHA